MYGDSICNALAVLTQGLRVAGCVFGTDDLSDHPPLTPALQAMQGGRILSRQRRGDYSSNRLLQRILSVSIFFITYTMSHQL